MWLFYKTGFQKQLVCQLSSWIVYKWGGVLMAHPLALPGGAGGGRPLHDDPRHRQRPHRLFAGGGRRGLAEGRGQEDPCRRLRADIPSLRERERTLGVCR